MSWVDEEIKTLWGADFDPDEFRWVVFGKDPDGKPEWVETVSREYAESFLKTGIEEGHCLEIRKLTRGEIRNLYGEAEFSLYEDEENSCSIELLKGESVFGIASTPLTTKQ